MKLSDYKAYKTFKVVSVAAVVFAVLAVCAGGVKLWRMNQASLANEREYENFIRPTLSLAKAAQWLPTAGWETRDSPGSDPIRVTFPQGSASDLETIQAFEHFYQGQLNGQFRVQNVKSLPHACFLTVNYKDGKPDMAIGTSDKDIPQEILTQGPVLIHMLYREQNSNRVSTDFVCTLLPGVTEDEMLRQGLKPFNLRVSNKRGRAFDEAQFLHSLSQFSSQYGATAESSGPQGPIYRQMNLGSMFITQIRVENNAWVMKGYNF